MFRLKGKSLKMGVIAESEAETSKLARSEHTNRLQCPSAAGPFLRFSLMHGTHFFLLTLPGSSTYPIQDNEPVK